jgi:hypothetical protein
MWGIAGTLIAGSGLAGMRLTEEHDEQIKAQAIRNFAQRYNVQYPSSQEQILATDIIKRSHTDQKYH